MSIVAQIEAAREKRYPQVCKKPAPTTTETVRSLGASPLGARMQPDGMPSIAGMHRTHALCVVRSGERVWVRESMLTGCAD